MRNDEMSIVRRYISNPPVDVQAMIRDLDIEYVEVPMESTDSGRIESDGEGNYRIVVNANDGAQRRRFTAAHEVAHYLLHRDLLDGRGHLDRLFGSNAYSNPDEPFERVHEVQANRYAADILMPSAAIKKKLGSDMADAEDVPRLASIFNVSRLAMRIRLENIGLLAPEHPPVEA